jgi:hypothetical protein
VIGIRRLVSKGYGRIVDVDLASGLSDIAPRPVGKPAANNREQPRHEWTIRVVGRTDGVQRQQDVLDQVFDIGRAGKSTAMTDNLADARRDALQELQIGLRVACLCCAHQVCKLFVSRHGPSLP